MIRRRQFLGCVTAIAGSTILTACGGGDQSTPSGTATTTGTAATTGTTTTSAIVTSTSATNSSSGGTNSSSSAAPNEAASAAAAPTIGSPDGTTIPPATSITDKNGAVWTVVNEVIYRNGATVGDTYNVTLLLWYGGMVYHRGTGGQFFVCTNLVWLPVTDPRTPVAAATGHFYGINGHYDYLYTPAQIVSILKGLGCTTYRLGCTADPSQLNPVIQLAQAFQASGLTLFVLISQGLYDTSGKLYSSESVAYSQGYSAAAAIANALQQYGVTMYECGNELTRDSAIVLNSANAGTNPVDFNNSNWPVMRGAMRGMIDGVKSVQPGAKCGINFCVCDIGASDALWDGMQPDGSGGYPTVRWDLTTWHNYEVYGDIFDIGTDGASPGINLPVYCKARYGVPFMLTEWNANPEDSDTYRGTYITAKMGECYQARATDNIQSLMYYELDSGDDTWGIMLNGAQINPPYSAFKNFVAAYPDT